MLRRVCVMLASIAGWFLATFLYYGNISLEYLQFHKLRGLQIESLYSSLVMLSGKPFEIYHQFGGYNIRSSLTPYFVQLSQWIVVSGVVFICGLFLWRVLRYGSDLKLFIETIVLVLLFSITFSKVFSPQYLLWVFPFIGLLDRRDMCLFGGIAMLTTLIFPVYYFSEILPTVSPLGLGLIASRNVMMVGIVLHLLYRLVLPMMRASDQNPSKNMSPDRLPG